MAVSKEGSTDAVDVQSRMDELSSLLKARASKLCPCNVAPRLFKPFTTISGLCSTKKQRVDAEAIIKSKAIRAEAQRRRTKQEAEMVTEEEGRGEEEDEDRQMNNIIVVTQTDLASRTFRVTGVKFADKIDATLYDLERLMELHLNSSEKDLEPYVRRFASANELGPDTPAAPIMQEVCSLSYALQVTASNLSGWTGRVGSHDLPLAVDADMAAVIEELFETPLPSERQKSTVKSGNKKGERGRSKKKKKGRSKEGQSVSKEGPSVSGEGNRRKAKEAKESSKSPKRKKR